MCCGLAVVCRCLPFVVYCLVRAACVCALLLLTFASAVCHSLLLVVYCCLSLVDCNWSLLSCVVCWSLFAACLFAVCCVLVCCLLRVVC